MSKLYDSLDERNRTFDFEVSYINYKEEDYRERLERELHRTIGKYLLDSLPGNKWTAVKPYIQWPTDRELYEAEAQLKYSMLIPTVKIRVRYEFMDVHFESA